MLATTFALVGFLATTLSAAVVPSAPKEKIPRDADAVDPGSNDGVFPEIVFVGEVPNTHAYITTNHTELAGRSISKRDQCFWWFDHLTHFRTSIARDFANRLQSASNAHQWHELRHGVCLKWRTGEEVMICACNDYIFENTHFKSWEAGWGALNRLDGCCGGAFDCRGGDVTGHGDSGLNIRISVMGMNGVYDPC